MITKGQKVISFLLCLLLVLSLLPLAQAGTAFAEESGKGQFLYYVNPMGGRRLSEEEVHELVDGLYQEYLDNKPRTAGDETLYTSVSAAASRLRSEMCARTPVVNIRLSVPGSGSSDAFQIYFASVFAAAVAHTGNPVEGDYLLYHLSALGLAGDSGWYTEDGQTEYNFYFCTSFRTTAAQEQELNGVVNNIISRLNVSGQSNYAKTKAVYDYLCANVTYDYAHLSDPDYELEYTAYAALKNNSAVCQGYALAMYRLCLALGVECRFIGDDVINHAWNAVSLGGKYYYADSTWDAEAYAGYEYFLRGRDFWSANHMVGDCCGYYDDAYYNESTGTWPLEPALNFSDADYPGITSYTPHITTQPENQTAATGSSVKYSVKTDNSVYSYKWQVKLVDSNTWEEITSGGFQGVNSATLTVPATMARNGYRFRCVLENGYGVTYTKTVRLTVIDQLGIIEHPKNVTVADGATATMSVKASGTNLSYQWQVRTKDSQTWYNVNANVYSGGQTATLTIPATLSRSGLQFRCKVTNSTGTVYSNGATLTVIAKPTITKHPSNVTVADGATAKMSVTASGANLSYQWQVRTKDGEAWYNVNANVYSGGQTATLTIPATLSRSGLQFRCKVTNAAGTAYSNGATLTVLGKPTITKQPASVTVADGATAKMSVTASGANLSYQWQVRTKDSQTWYNVNANVYSGGQTATLTIPATLSRSGLQFRCKVTNTAGTAYSNGATLTVFGKPTITKQPASVTVADGATAKMSVTASGTNLSYQWQVRTKDSQTWYNVNANVYSGGQTATLTIPATLSRSGLQFRCKVTNAAGTVYSNGATLTVFGKPTITKHPSNVTVADGATTTMSVTASGTNLSYQWQVRTKDSQTWYNVNANVYSGGQTATLTIPAKLSRSGLQFRCKVTNAAGTVYSNAATLTVKP